MVDKRIQKLFSRKEYVIFSFCDMFGSAVYWLKIMVREELDKMLAKREVVLGDFSTILDYTLYSLKSMVQYNQEACP